MLTKLRYLLPIHCLTIALLTGAVWAQDETDDDSGTSDTKTINIDGEQPADSEEIEPLPFLFDGGTPSSVEDLELMEGRFKELTEKLFPCTVNIQMGQSQGSGVVVSSDGYILTAAHVIGKPGQTATVTFPNKRRYLADTLGVSEGRIDSGMLKIRNPDNEYSFQYIDLGISEDLKLGQWVMAVGHPGGVDFDRGLVARVGRIVFSSDQVIRTDCTLVGGDSGGPLIDMHGQLIGIHSRIGGSLADNLHVPVDQYSVNWDKLAAGLILSGRPGLGFGVLGETNRVETVTEEKSAAIAGMKVNDIVLSIEGINVSSKEEISEALKELNLYPNQKIEIVVKRGEEEITLNVTVGER